MRHIFLHFCVRFSEHIHSKPSIIENLNVFHWKRINSAKHKPSIHVKNLFAFERAHQIVSFNHILMLFLQDKSFPESGSGDRLGPCAIYEYSRETLDWYLSFKCNLRFLRAGILKLPLIKYLSVYNFRRES